MKVQFNADPLSVQPQPKLMAIDRGDSGKGWQLRYWNKPFPRVGLKLRAGMIPHEIEAEEVVEWVRTFCPNLIVMTEDAYNETFKALFEAPTVQHTVATPGDGLVDIGNVEQAEVVDATLRGTGSGNGGSTEF